MIDVRNLFTNAAGRPGTNGPVKISKANLKGIAVHHAVTTTMLESASQEEELAALKNVERYHVSIGYGLFAYHFATFPSGRIYWIGDPDGQRAHVAGRNHELVGIVQMGTFTTSMPGASQLKAIGEGIRAIRQWWDRDDLPVKGHGMWALPGQGTACAGAPMNAMTQPQWDAIAGAAAPAPQEGDMLHRHVGSANPDFFSGLRVSGEQIVWTNSPVAGDWQLPDEARSMVVSVYLTGGEMDLLDGDGQKAGFCHGRVSTHEVIRGTDPQRSIRLYGDGIIDRLEVLGWR